MARIFVIELCEFLAVILDLIASCFVVILSELLHITAKIHREVAGDEWQIIVQWIELDACFTAAVEHVLILERILACSMSLETMMITIIIKELLASLNWTIDHDKVLTIM